MAETVKILGQVAPLVTTATTLYTVPAATSAVVSSIVACNQNAANVRVRLAFRLGGAALDPKQYVWYDALILSNLFLAETRGFTLAAGDVVTVYSDTANVSFTLYGVEVT